MNVHGLVAQALIATGSPVEELARAYEWSLDPHAGHFCCLLDESELFVQSAIISTAALEYGRAAADPAC